MYEILTIDQSDLMIKKHPINERVGWCSYMKEGGMAAWMETDSTPKRIRFYGVGSTAASSQSAGLVMAAF